MLKCNTDWKTLKYFILSGVVTYHQIKDDEVLIEDFLDLIILGEDFLQPCGRKLTLSFITRVCREQHRDDQADITYEQTHSVFKQNKHSEELNKWNNSSCSPWLCGQSSRWKMTSRGLFLKYQPAHHKLQRILELSQSLDFYFETMSYFDLDQ